MQVTGKCGIMGACKSHGRFLRFVPYGTSVEMTGSDCLYGLYFVRRALSIQHTLDA